MSGALGQWFKEKINRDMSVVSTDGGEMLNPQQELARKNKELADKTALENEVRRGELIETDVVEAAWTDILARVGELDTALTLRCEVVPLIRTVLRLG